MAKTVSGTLMMSGALVKSGYYSFTNVTGEIVLALPADASFRLSAKVSDKQDLVSDFPLKYTVESSPVPRGPRVLPPAPKPVPTREPQLPPDAAKQMKEKEKEKPAAKPAPPAKTPAPPRSGVMVTPAPPGRLIFVPVVRRIEAICGSGDATISVASFGGAVHLKKL